MNVTLLALKILLFGYAGLPSSQLAASVFTFGTVAVLPFYTLMVAAPKAELVSKDILELYQKSNFLFSQVMLHCFKFFHLSIEFLFQFVECSSEMILFQ